jgi:hypothetical protein
MLVTVTSAVAAAPQGRMLTYQNTIVLPVRTTRMTSSGLADSYIVERHVAKTGALLWSAASVFINTPISSDNGGGIFFGYEVLGATPIGLQSGVARISSKRVGSWTSVQAATGDASMTHVQTNGGPAVSIDGNTVYLVISNGSAGYLVGLDSHTLAPSAFWRATFLHTTRAAGYFISMRR